MKLLIGAGVSIIAAAVLFGWNFIFPPAEFKIDELKKLVAEGRQKTKEERIAEARERASEIKGLYMTADVASDLGVGATRIRNNLIHLAETTEINGLVIDVKEVCGPDYNETNIKKLLAELKEKNIWAIARIAVSKDASQINAHPDWYLTRKAKKGTGDECFRKKHLRAKPAGNQLPVISNQPLWRDKRGGYWMDPASPAVREYLLQFSKKMIDLGFDELQFDYIRFPSDGDVENAIYPAWDKKTHRCAVMKSLFEYLNQNLKSHKPEIILSADLFGYAALGIDTGIGQCLDHISENFDYVSFMVYPSHYYSGLSLKAVPELGLAPVNYNVHQARTNPDVVIERSLRFARDFWERVIDLSGKPVVASSTASTTPLHVEKKARRVYNRPWLEDFYHEEDRAAGRPYGIEKVRKQIDAAERVEKRGWLLWNAANIYTESALKKE